MLLINLPQWVSSHIVGFVCDDPTVKKPPKLLANEAKRRQVRFFLGKDDAYLVIRRRVSSLEKKGNEI